MPGGREVSSGGAALIGNDVVDLEAPEARRKAADGRFLRRVFTAGERARILAAADPDRMLWTLWAAKEAAFKVARKLCADLPFAHRRLEAWLDEPVRGEAAGRATGRVRLHGWPAVGLEWLQVEWRTTRQLVHCVARTGCMPGSEGGRPASVHAAVAPGDAEPAGDRRAAVLTRRERDGARTAESRRVRRLAKALAREAGLGPIEIVRQRRDGILDPPRLYARSAAVPLPGWDLSLSHDGRFVAAALVGVRRAAP